MGDLQVYVGGDGEVASQVHDRSRKVLAKVGEDFGFVVGQHVDPLVSLAFVCMQQARYISHHQSSESGPGDNGRRQIAPGNETGRTQEQGRSFLPKLRHGMEKWGNIAVRSSCVN